VIYPVTVLKLGGSVLRDQDDLSLAVHEIYRWIRQGHRVVAVVSAFEGTTDALLSRGRELTDNAGEDATAMLLATGEFTTAALLALALSRAGVPTRVVGPHALGLRTRGLGADADPASINVPALRHALMIHPVVVVPGFVGVGEDQNLTLLGRGGSDLTALFISAELGNTHCRLIKDVDGLYERDPAIPGPRPRRYRSLSWDQALTLDGGIVQHKAVRLARERRLSFEVGSFQREDVSTIGDHPLMWHAASSVCPPIRVALLGCGVVGGGVLSHLRRLPDQFEVTGVLVRTLEGPNRAITDVPFTTDPHAAIPDADIVIEALGGLDPAADIVGRALREGRDVVTANKALIAAHADELLALATDSGATLHYSAAVGGGVPMLEAIDRLSRSHGVRAFEGVLNGTTNFVLERLASGQDLESAVREAQRLGLAEADPTRDLDAIDAYEKLHILARHAFGPDTSVAAFTRSGLLGPELKTLQESIEPGNAIRLVAWARQTSAGVQGGVGPCVVTPAHPLRALGSVQNRLLVWDGAGRTHSFTGDGAGRWPTSESVMADLLDLGRSRRTRQREAITSEAHNAR
jgi:homoserine dehydrogenase